MPLFRRKDADLVRDLPDYRRMMPLLMRTRNESAVLFEQRVDATRALEFIARHNETHDRKISLFHLVVWAIVQTLAERPRLNRFTSGGRLYQRRGIWISYSAKKAFDVHAEFKVDDTPAAAPWKRPVAASLGKPDPGLAGGSTPLSWGQMLAGLAFVGLVVVALRLEGRPVPSYGPARPVG